MGENWLFSRGVKFNSRFFLSACLLLPLTFAGCSARGGKGALTIESVRQATQMKPAKMPLSIDREIYRSALANAQVNRIRMVELFLPRPNPDLKISEYRLFEIQSGSVFKLLGLENRDVLVAADGYVVQTPNQFYEYIVAIAGAERAEIEVRRDGKPLKFEISFKDKASS